VNTLRSKSNASLCSATSCDHRFTAFSLRGFALFLGFDAVCFFMVITTERHSRA
jgi:hypothetical protein